MEIIKSMAHIVLLTTLVLSAPPTARAQTQAELALPSFSIFGFSEKENGSIFNHQLSSKELERLLVEVQPTREFSEFHRKRATYFLIPRVFYGSRHLFVRQQWTKADIEESKMISRFFARLVEQPDLEIKSENSRQFALGLRNLSVWFGALTRNNDDLAAMIFTMDDGPYRGLEVDEKKFLQWKRLASATIPNSKSKFVLMTDNQAPEPMIIGVMNADDSLLWAKRYSDKPAGQGHLNNAELSTKTARKVEGYGYKLVMSMSGESSVVYLDEKLGLRFYYVSW